jgi:DNA-binding MarR family transcriptional regulator
MSVETFNPYQHFGFLTNRTGRLIGKILEPKMKEVGLDIPSSCIGILGELWVQDGLNQKKLGLSTIKNKSSINKMLQQLTTAGLIEKRTDEADRRISRIFLTRKGKQFQQKIITMSDDMDAILKAEHSEVEIETTKKVLTTLYHKLLEHLESPASL